MQEVNEYVLTKSEMNTTPTIGDGKLKLEGIYDDTVRTGF
jgi:hypothetical protein